MNNQLRLRTIFLYILFLFTFPVLLFCADDNPEDKHGIHEEFSHDQLKRGERLFYGLIPLGEGAVSCAQCHNIKELDTLNWNPSAYDIAVVSHEKSLGEFISAVVSPVGQKMSDVHQNYDLSEDDLQLIKAYLEIVWEEGPEIKKPAIIKRFLFLLAIILFFLAITDMAITRKLRFKIIHTVVILACLFYVIDVTVKEAIAVGRSPGYAPDQPIKFSHKIHVGQNNIDCLYCHNTAEHSKSAGIPSAGVCLNCHNLVVKEGTRSGSFEINKIKRAVARGEPIIWNRVYALPDHVFFSHAQHVNAGEVECAICHGEVEEMDIIRQFNDLSMGWCVNCHRDTEIQFIDNVFYEKYEKLHEELASGKREKVSVEDIGGIECMKCHY
ncbi:cytochrome c3 family protein [Bacteroidota bacterium]